MAMADSLKNNDFWRKKIHAAVKARDTDGDGFITRADFQLILQHYKNSGSPPEHIKKLQESLQTYYKIWDLTDESTKLTLEEFKDLFLRTIEQIAAHADEFFSGCFEQVDMNGDGVISLTEWQVHNTALRIDAESAKASFEAMDADGDDKVTTDEFIAYHKEFFLSAEDKLKSSLLFGPLK